MTFRRFIFWLHLAVGLGIGLVVAFLAITGSVLAFQPQVTAWAERSFQISQPVAGATCVPASSLLTTAAALQHRSPSTLTLFSDPHRPAEITFGRDTLLLLDPCTGSVLGTGSAKLRSFFANVKDLHRWIAFQGVRHETLRSIKDAATLVFLLLLLSGLFLWFPRQWSWKHYKPALFFRFNRKGRAREWNLHNIFGFWAFLPLIAIVVTGLIMAYPWANGLLYRAAGSPPPAGRPESEPKQSKPLDSTKYGSLDPLVQQAIVEDPRWASLSMRMPSQKDAVVAFTLDEGRGGRPQQRTQLSLARNASGVTHRESFDSLPRGRQWRLYARYLHTGELFGLPGQVIAFLTTISLLVLVWTGFSLSLRRWSAWRRKAIQAKKELAAQEVSA